MQMSTKLCRKSESSLSFSCANTVTEGTNLRPVKAVRRDERFLSLAQINKLKKREHRAFNWPKFACINLSNM